MNSDCGEAKCSHSLVLANPKYSRLASPGRNVFSMTQSGPAVPSGWHTQRDPSRQECPRAAPGTQPARGHGPTLGGQQPGAPFRR